MSPNACEDFVKNRRRNCRTFQRASATSGCLVVLIRKQVRVEELHAGPGIQEFLDQSRGGIFMRLHLAFEYRAGP